jgi:hypothetical protein
VKLIPEQRIKACIECPFYYHHEYADYPICQARAHDDDDELSFDPSIPGFQWKEESEEGADIDEPWQAQIHEDCPLTDAPVATVKASC